MRLSRFGFVILAFCLSIGVAAAGNFSFTGTFSQDDQLQVFLFTAPSASTLLRTWSYAGGTNAAGQVILPGGFDPILSVFDATGGLLSPALCWSTATTMAPAWPPTRPRGMRSIRCCC